MQIQKGLVKYKDRTDIVCTYGITDDSKQYYFLDENSISNGNIIASTALVEAIDPVVVASNVGVIDKDGNVIIPFENRMIKTIAPGLLLVEKANSTTPSVVEAIKLRSDPLAATKLVTTPATIKDQINSKMGNEGRFVFNDQFSEATICDINGNNLLNNEYYSFIGFKSANTLYLSKNTIESPVVEFVLDVTIPTAATDVKEPLDVQKTDITAATIEGAMNSAVTSDITAADFENVALNEEDSQVMVENNVQPVESASQEEVVENTVVEEVKDNGFSAADVAADMTATSIPNLDTSVTSTVEVKEEEIPAVESVVEDKLIEETKEETQAEEVKVEEVKEEPVVEVKEVEEEKFDSYAPTEEAIELPLSTPVEKEEVKEDTLAAFDFGDNINYSSDVKPIDLTNRIEEDDDSLFKELVEKESSKTLEIEKEVNDFKKDLFDLELESDIFASSVVHADKIVDDIEPKVEVKDTMFEDVASTLANLIKLSKSQKEKIAVYETKFEQIADTHKRVVEKARSQVRDMEVLKAKVKNYETIVNRLESKIQLLENKVEDQEKVINSQTNELESLRPQVAGKNELARILADAQSLLDEE